MSIARQPGKLLPQVLWRVLPAATLVLLVSWLSVSWVTQNELRSEAEARLTQGATDMARATGVQIGVIETAAQSLAANGLLIGGLTDIQQREGYLAAFFQSLRIPGPAGALITLADYRGRPIAVNGPFRSYFKASWVKTVMKGQRYFHLSRTGMLVAAPVMLDGRPEGIVVVEYGPGAIAQILGQLLKFCQRLAVRI